LKTERWEKDGQFQSTPSVGRATPETDVTSAETKVSIHALRGEGDNSAALNVAGARWVSIHALRGEGDVVWWVCSVDCGNVSIHALRGEGDLGLFGPCLDFRHCFNPRPPWGGRLPPMQ